MARPRLYCVVWELGEAVAIIEGRENARKVSASFKAFKSRNEAEEFAAWWNYDHPRWYKVTPAARPSPKPSMHQ